MAYYILRSFKANLSAPAIFEAFSRQKGVFFLDSSLHCRERGRFSFIGSDPFLIFQAKGKDPIPRLRQLMNRYSFRAPSSSPPFLTGAVGYLSYDLGFAFEKSLRAGVKENPGIPESFFAFYNTTVIIDHWKRLLYVCASGFPESSLGPARLLAENNFRRTLRLIEGVKNQKIKYPRALPPWGLKTSMGKQEYLRAVKTAKEYIRRGDIYQVNLSQEFRARTKATAVDIYRRLRDLSPSCFSAYFDAGDHQLLSSSPERFLLVEGKRVSTRPMKGTRPRAGKAGRDLCLKNDLLKSAKDKAELMMIVDLERNDLGKVCDYHSLRVKRLRQLEAYRTVYQTTADIEGRLYKNKDRLDALRSCFPGGSITGCPKIRSMEIIEKLEKHRRSIYTGALGYLSCSGNMDFNILIRTILKKKERVYFCSGGGIVADSSARQEFQEMLVKAGAMLKAIGARKAPL
jgi:para-aminobenzoate synthetase component 1